jgi:hypothetical protein
MMRRKRSLGCAHLFRPTYAGANVGHPSIASDAAMTQTPRARTDFLLKILQIRPAHLAVAPKTAASAGMNPAETGSVCR